MPIPNLPPHLDAGHYTLASHNLRIAVPCRWTLREDGDDIEIASPDAETAVLLSIVRRSEAAGDDCRTHLSRFMETRGLVNECELARGRRDHASIVFRDPDGTGWEILFSNGPEHLVIATCNGQQDEELAQARAVLASIEWLAEERETGASKSQQTGKPEPCAAPAS